MLCFKKTLKLQNFFGKMPLFLERNIKEDKLISKYKKIPTGKPDMISIKIHKKGNDLLIGACDEKLLGKKFEDGKFQIIVSKDFYGGKRVNTDALKKYLQNATIANLVGKETIKCAIDLELIDPECVIKIKGVPHAQMVRMLT